MRLLVTGGAGFIGSALVHYLLGPAEDEWGWPVARVITLDKLTYAGHAENLAAFADDDRHRLVQGDIADRPLVARLLDEHRIDAVLHLAAESFVDSAIASPAPFVETNFAGTFHLLEAARAHAVTRPGFRFLHVSTDEVFGALRPGDPAFTEASPYAPNNVYAATKAGADFLVRAYHHTYGLDVVTTNCSNNYGPRQHPEKLIPFMLRRLLRGEPLPLYGDGLQVRDWLHVEDHARGLVLALRKGRPGETYAFGGREEHTNFDVVRRLIAHVAARPPVGRPVPTEALITHVTDRLGHDRRYAIDSTKAETELGWKTRENFADGLARTVEWYLSHEDWLAAAVVRSSPLANPGLQPGGSASF